MVPAAAASDTAIGTTSVPVATDPVNTTEPAPVESPVVIEPTTTAEPGGTETPTGPVNLTVIPTETGTSAKPDPAVSPTDSSISPAPHPDVPARFTGSPLSGKTPLTVQFTANSGTAETDYLWEFYDGSPQSAEKNPVHIYTHPGNFPVTLRTYSKEGSMRETRDDYIHVTDTSNVELIGDLSKVTNPPSGNDYVRLGGSSGIRRDGSVQLFVWGPDLSGKDWISVTNGAAIKTDGTLVTWIPGKTYISYMYFPSEMKRKYVAISQYSDWLLAIYEDADGMTHLDAFGEAADHPAVFKNIPRDTGWKMVAAGNNHALALRSDGTLVAWGDNSYGQLGLPTDKVYADIAAGEDFSLGLTSVIETNHGGTIYAKGKDDYQQVTGVPKDPDAYIQIEAGSSTGAALTHDGTIKTWGKNLAGTPVPADAGYTDISLCQDFAFALKETGREFTVTGPISPGKPIPNANGINVDLPAGSTLEHTRNDVTRMIRPDGTVIGWANDERSARIRFPRGAVLPTTLIHYVPTGSTIDGRTNYRATVSPPGGLNGDIMTVTESAWYDEEDPSLPQTLPLAICFSGSGCSAAIASKQQLFLSDPMPMSGNGIPIFSVRQLPDNSWVGTLSTLSPANPAESRSLIMEKNRVSPDQPIGFGIVTGDGSTGTNVFVTAQANLTNQSSVLHYTITGTTSTQVPEMNIMPTIWKKTTTGDVLAYTGTPVTCSAATSCIATGNFTPTDAAKYYDNATVLYTVPAATADGVAVGTQVYGIVAASGVRATSSTPYVAFIEGCSCMAGDPKCPCFDTSSNGSNTVDSPEDLATAFKDVMDEAGQKGTTQIDAWSIIKNQGGNARESHWISKKKDNLEKGDFGFYAGHGNEGLFTFCHKDSGAADYNFSVTSKPAWGSEGRLRWVTIHSCMVLKNTVTNLDNWKDLIKKTGTGGIHSILGFDTYAKDGSGATDYYARLMKGKASGEIGTPWEIIKAWKYALQKKLNDKDYRGAYIYDEATLHDHLPGLGEVYTPGRTSIQYCSFTCVPDKVTKIDNNSSSNWSPVTEGKYVLNTSLPEVPKTIEIYKPVLGKVTKVKVAALAKALHLNGEVEENDVNYRIVSDDFYFFVNKETGHTYFTNNKRGAGSNGIDMPENLPSDSDAIKIVASFLKSVNMTPADYTDVSTIHEGCMDVTETGNHKPAWDSVLVFYQRQLNSIVVEGSRFSVNVGSGGDIIELFINWRDYTPYKEVPLKSPETAYAEFRTKKLLVHGQHIDEQTDKVTIDHISLVYYTRPATEKERYLEPVYRFEGEARLGTSSERFEAIAIPAMEVPLDAIQ